MSNHLKGQLSPYLLQHSENPVDWYPWCEEAFLQAKAQDKPIFLSIGYSTCHWCHVMAHESFEDSRTARFLNDHFISIKVDREERPDIDSVYMAVCQAFTGSGGWPLSVFMTWEKQPFFAGTYFPVHSQYGTPGFLELLTAIVRQWEHDRHALFRSAGELVEQMKKAAAAPATAGRKGENLPKAAVSMLARLFDRENGGFGPAPKFPTPHNLLFLLLYAKISGENAPLQMAAKTLRQMRRGGLFDQIGYGFSRYSTDNRFLVPHFEKMLYDNALLITAYAAAFRLTEDPFFLNTAEQTAEYVLREMTAPGGGFYSAQDADSEGDEGKYYTFTSGEIRAVLGEEQGKRFARAFDITDSGNFMGKNIPNRLKSGEEDSPGVFEEERQCLYRYRKNRFPLSLDDKILRSWNSLMIAALCMLHRVSKKEEYRRAACRAQRFLEENLQRGSRLFTSFREGERTDRAFLDDYAFSITALLELYASTLDRETLQKAEALCRETMERFADREGGGFFLCPTGSEELFLNPKETYDGAIPSGNSVMAYNLVRLYQLTGKDEYRVLFQKQCSFLSPAAREYPIGHGLFLLSLLLWENPPPHITVVMKDARAFPRELPPDLLCSLPLLCDVQIVPESREYPLVNGKDTYYICENHACRPPVNILPSDLS